MDMRLLAALVLGAPTACQPSPAASGPDLAGDIHTAVMEAYPAYGDLPEPKVMAACITWQPGSKPPARVRQLFPTYTARSSDALIFAADLANDAKHRCKRWRKEKELDCKCQMLDMNGKNVLKEPE